MPLSSVYFNFCFLMRILVRSFPTIFSGIFFRYFFQELFKFFSGIFQLLFKCFSGFFRYFSAIFRLLLLVFLRLFFRYFSGFLKYFQGFQVFLQIFSGIFPGVLQALSYIFFQAHFQVVLLGSESRIAIC